MTEQSHSNSNLIQNKDLAEEMAYGEKPHRELAALATASGLDQEAVEQLHKADNAGVKAGQTYLDSLHNQLAASAKAEQVGATPEFVSPEVWQAMSPEQRTKASEMRSAIAEGPLKEYGVTAESLRVVMFESEGRKQFTLIHTGNGVDIGNPKEEYDEARSYNSVMSPKNDGLFTFKIDGKQYDSRQGMTDATYFAKVADAKERGVTLPDSQPLSAETGDDWTWTMLTGEPITADGHVQLRYVYDGQVCRDDYHPDGGDRVLRVCPAVGIE